MAFSKKSKSNKKEFIEYKDGKLISTPVESSRKPKRIETKESIPDYQETPQLKKKEKKHIDLSSYLSWKKIKPVFITLFFIFLAWAIYDLYESFIEPTTTEYIPEEQTEETIETPSTKLPQDKVVESPKVNVEGKDGLKDEEKSGSDELSYALRRASEVNTVVVTTSMKELDYLHEYLEREANRMGLEDHIQRQLVQKEKAHYQFLEDKIFYETPSLQNLYVTTEKRIRLSIKFSKEMKSLLVGVSNRSEIAKLRDRYIEEDQKLKEEQTEHLLRVLEFNQIAYEYNEVNQSIRYSIK